MSNGALTGMMKHNYKKTLLTRQWLNRNVLSCFFKETVDSIEWNRSGSKFEALGPEISDRQDELNDVQAYQDRVVWNLVLQTGLREIQPEIYGHPHNICSTFGLVWFDSFYVHPCQHGDSYVDGQSQIKVHTDERTQVHSARSFLMFTHPCINRGRRCLTWVNVPLS